MLMLMLTYVYCSSSSFLKFFVHSFRFLSVLSPLQWNCVFVRCHPVASVLPELPLFHGVWGDILAISAQRGAAVQWWCRQQRLPCYKLGGQIFRVQVWLRLWRSCYKVTHWSPSLPPAATDFWLSVWFVVQEWRADQSALLAWVESISNC